MVRDFCGDGSNDKASGTDQLSWSDVSECCSTFQQWEEGNWNTECSQTVFCDGCERSICLGLNSHAVFQGRRQGQPIHENTWSSHSRGSRLIQGVHLCSPTCLCCSYFSHSLHWKKKCDGKRVLSYWEEQRLAHLRVRGSSIWHATSGPRRSWAGPGKTCAWQAENWKTEWEEGPQGREEG